MIVVKTFNPVTSSNCCRNKHNNDLEKIAISVLADSDKKIVIFDFDFKIVTELVLFMLR